ncbi:NADPH:quinone reductase-like Zn-dependent oxidoreductase [Kibdelosporangium banguiense]|uniref:NADPH:quinone reductase-like Zn-dependent oxidoreductase n=1 Tax=Kibdelosporangium banguiense TaxID=1365924 RepID=A0ABS4T7P8_9PSEU|nr:NADP-dependent oxidoreductase [Kibdelosporangium banguiense]MBP2320413.1 NADPH:quinone reductase-like Zn-dependent oxidoreductase [Kibdelosporangium banguiense]
MTTHSMYAVRQLGYGGSEVLRIATVERPVPGPGQVLVRVRAAGVNPADWKTRAGLAGHHSHQPPFTPGMDVAGVVEAVGGDVTDFKPGDAVYGMVFPPNGAQAQYTVTPAGMLARVPSEVDIVQAGALATAGLTAWQALVTTAQVAPGQRVLVHAAAGGVGHLAVQIAKARGAHVIGTARAGKHAFLRELGADELIDYTRVDFTEAISDRVDIVLDPLGDDYAPRSLTILAPSGIFIDLRQPNPGRAEVRATAGKLGVRFADVIVSPNTTDLTQLAALAARGQLRVAVEETLPLANVAKAQELSESGRVQGKIVLIP